MDQEVDPQVPLHTDLTQARPCNSSTLYTGYIYSLSSSPHRVGESPDIWAIRHSLPGNDSEKHGLPYTNVFSGNNMAAMPEMLNLA